MEKVLGRSIPAAGRRCRDRTLGQGLKAGHKWEKSHRVPVLGRGMGTESQGSPQNKTNSMNSWS